MPNMNMQDLGAIGELLAALATLITLIYLALQIRQNSISLQESTSASMNQGWSSINTRISSDPQFASIFIRGRADLDDLDAVVASLSRFIAASRNPTSLLALFERDAGALPALLQVFATSQTLANRLISDPESFDLLRASDGQPADRRFLVDELAAELNSIEI